MPELETAIELSNFRDGNGKIHQLVRLANGGDVRNCDSDLVLTVDGRAVVEEVDRRGLHPEARPEIPRPRTFQDRGPGD